MSVKEWWGKLPGKLKHCTCEGPEARKSLVVSPNSKVKGKKTGSQRENGRGRQEPGSAKS